MIGASEHPDVRMRGFPRRHTVRAALEWLDAQLCPLGAETVPLKQAAGRVLAAPIVSEVEVPAFDRATMDGYAVVAQSVEGATPYTPVCLRVIGDSMPGAPFPGRVTAENAVRIMTGAPVPAGADAVLPAEFVERDEKSARGGPAAESHPVVMATAAVPPAKNIGRRGEDVTSGTVVLERGRRLRPQDVGVISSIGVADVPVVCRPRVRLVITGNELLPAGTRPHDHQIADANGPMLAALAERDGALVDFPGLVRDDATDILAALQSDADVILVSGGSSVGIEDLAPLLLARHGELAVHGIAMRPSSPTGFGRLGDRFVFLLPGNPVSALCAYDFFAGRAIRTLGGGPAEWPYRAVKGRLARKLTSPIGRLDYARVRLADGRVEPMSVSGASVLSSTTRADGFVVVPDDSEGYPAGAEVEVWLYA